MKATEKSQRHDVQKAEDRETREEREQWKECLGQDPFFTRERDYWLDCSLSLWTLHFLHQVTCISSLTPLYSTQLCEFLCVPDGGEHLGNDYWLDLSPSFSFPPFILLATSVPSLLGMEPTRMATSRSLKAISSLSVAMTSVNMAINMQSYLNTEVWGFFILNLPSNSSTLQQMFTFTNHSDQSLKGLRKERQYINSTTIT